MERSAKVDRLQEILEQIVLKVAEINQMSELDVPAQESEGSYR